MNKCKSLYNKFRNPNLQYRYSHVFLIYIFLFVFIVVMSIANEYFRDANNFRNIMDSSFPLMMAAFGQMIVILTGGIDLSIGGMITLANCLSVTIMTQMEGVGGALFAILATIVACSLCGAINGLFITKGRLPAIIVTIATEIIFNGIALFLMPAPGGAVNKEFAKFIGARYLGLPVSFFIMIILVILVRILTNRMPYGRALRAVGGNESAAYSTGISVWKVKFKAYVLAGFFCAIGGIYLSARMYSADPQIGTTYSMNSITASVVGGTLMTGAIGDVLGTVVGVFIIFIIYNVLNLLGVSSYYQYIAQGIILIFALIISSFESRHR